MSYYETMRYQATYIWPRKPNKNITWKNDEYEDFRVPGSDDHKCGMFTFIIIRYYNDYKCIIFKFFKIFTTILLIRMPFVMTLQILMTH